MPKKKTELKVISFITENNTTRLFAELSEEEKKRVSDKMMANCSRGMSLYYQNKMSAC